MNRDELMSKLIGEVLEKMVVFAHENTALTPPDTVIALTEAASFAAVNLNCSREDFVNLAGQAYDLMLQHEESFKNVQ